MNVKKIGNESEKFVANIFKSYKYWCHVFAYKASGQPCDIVAVNQTKTFLVDVKECKEDRLSFNRIEDNQRSCFNYCEKLNIPNIGFVIVYDNKAYYLPYEKLKELESENEKSVNVGKLKELKYCL